MLVFRRMRAVVTLVAFLAISGCSSDEGKKWALLVSGASGYDLYCLQAGVCHAYQVFHEHGIPDENIVVMMYDDIAYNDRNPFPGEVVNHPEGPNVYPGVPHDYVSTDVNTDVFLAVLQGDKDRVYELTGYHGKVIDSGPNDRVFVYLATLGSPGYVCMPEKPNLYASELNEAIQSMYESERFANLVFYLETSFGGSMFVDLLPDTIDAYALTSANPDEEAYACYYDFDRGTWLGGCFSCAWLENCDEEDMTVETMQEQFGIIVEGTEDSSPTQYGDLSFTSWAVSEFIGNGKPFLRPQASNTRSAMMVPMNELEMFTLKQRLADPREKSHEEEIRAELEEKVWLQAHTDVFFSSLVSAAVSNEDVDSVLNSHHAIKQRSAYEFAVAYLMDVCPRLGSFNRFVLGKMNALVNLTNRYSLRQVVAAVDIAASTSPLCYNQ